MKRIIGISDLLERASTAGGPVVVTRRLVCGSHRRRQGRGARSPGPAVAVAGSFGDVLRRWSWWPIDPLTRRDPSESDLQWLEDEIGVGLPSEYRGFLRTHGWTRFADAMSFPLVEAAPWGQGARISSFLGFSSDIRRDLGFLVSEFYADELPEGTIPIASDGSDNIVLLGVSGTARDRVWFWDRECRGLDSLIDDMVRDLENEGITILDDDEHQITRKWESAFPERRTRPLGFTSVYAVADSFAAFLASLRSAER